MADDDKNRQDKLKTRGSTAQENLSRIASRTAERTVSAHTRLTSPVGSRLNLVKSTDNIEQVSGAPFLQLPPQLQGFPALVKKTFSGRQRGRQSGLFSDDDLSIDVSPTGSQIIQRPRAVSEARRQSLGPKVGSGLFSVNRTASGIRDEPRRHPISIASASIGSSIGSELYPWEDAQTHNKKHRYRFYRRKFRRFRRKYKGCIFALLSSFSSSLSSHVVHTLTTNKNYSVSYCLLWRYVGVLFPGILIVLYYRFCPKEMIFDTIWPLTDKEQLKRFGFCVLRSVVDVLAVVLNYYAFRTLLQSETSTILNSKPVVVQLLAHFTLGEPWGIVPIVVSVFAAVGVMIISKPPFLEGKAMEGSFENRLEGVGFAIGSMLMSAVLYVILRYLKDVHYSILSVFIGFVGLVCGVGMTLVDDTFVWAQVEDLPYFFSLAFLVCCSSISIVIALQNEEAFVVSLVRSFDVVLSFIWESVLENKKPDRFSVGGASIIMLCVMIIFFRKYLEHTKPESCIYRNLRFLTK